MLNFFRLTFSQKLFFLLGSFAFQNIVGVESRSNDHTALFNITKSSLANLTAANTSAFVLFFSNRYEIDICKDLNSFPKIKFYNV